jgi:hypothetical protein
VTDVGSLRVGAQLAVERVGDPALEAAQRFELGLAGRELAPVVGPTFGVEADLADRGDVDHVVHPTVSSPREAVPVLLAGGGAFRHGLVDECVLLLCPVLFRGGKPALPRGVRLDLELLDHRRFDNGVVPVRHAVRHPA